VDCSRLGQRTWTSRGGECATDQWPVGVYKAQHAAHRNPVTRDGADDVDLLEDSVNQLDAVPATYDQPFHT